VNNNILDLQNLTKNFYSNSTKTFYGSKNNEHTTAVDDVSFSIKNEEIFGLVGESGCGKTTLTRLILKILVPDKGDIFYNGEKLSEFDKNQMKQFRNTVRKIFQNPSASLNPEMKIQNILLEVLGNNKQSSKKEKIIKITKLLYNLGMDEDHLNRFPSELSSGQKKRISIARAFLLPPKLLLADEPFSGIDASHSKHILKYMMKLKQKNQITMLFISHDIDLIYRVADRIGVMYDGSIVEIFENDKLDHPKLSHPYTKELFESKNLENNNF